MPNRMKITPTTRVTATPWVTKTLRAAAEPRGEDRRGVGGFSRVDIWRIDERGAEANAPDFRPPVRGQRQSKLRFG